MEKILKLYAMVILIGVLGCDLSDEVAIQRGMVINSSVVFKADQYLIPGAAGLDEPIMVIEGDDITVDFNGAMIQGHSAEDQPHSFTGLGILVKNGKNITIRNLKIKGYKVGVMVENVHGFVLEDSDLSYNYRQKLGSYREREDYSDWLSYHQNDGDEWLRYGAGLYLKEVDSAIVRGILITGGQNGIMMTETHHGQFYNNKVAFNSGIGIGLYRSSSNRIMHNVLDWNVRGYSHGFYSRGQDSAGLLCYEQSNDNVFAYNSATHSGDGFFLWAGQSTMDSGEGGCNGNVLLENDFSYAPTNGIEVTFSSNKIIGNILKECRYGIWGGYSFDSEIVGNEIIDNDYGIAVEHGHDHLIEGNYFENNKVGIELWERAQQPQDWGFAQANDVRSRNYIICKNYFKRHQKVLAINTTQNLQLGPGNYFEGFGQVVEKKGFNQDIREYENYMEAGLSKAPSFSRRGIIKAAVKEGWGPLPERREAIGTFDRWAGRENIIMGEYGPYDFQYPEAVLRAIEGNRYIFLLTGPEGNWKLSGGAGFEAPNSKTGTLPATFSVSRLEGAENFKIVFTYIGKGGKDEFGRIINKGTPYKFGYEDNKVSIDWEMVWKNTGLEVENYYSDLDVLWRQSGKAITGRVEDDLAFAWWGSPAEGVSADGFITRAIGRIDVPQGRYKMLVTSDDGVVVRVDGVEVIQHWDVHEPERDEVRLDLDGEHIIEVYHFDKSGFSNLDVRLHRDSQ